jgi:protein SCO1/2
MVARASSSPVNSAVPNIAQHVLVVLLATGVASCRPAEKAPGAASAPADTSSQVLGLALSPPQEKPTFTLTDTQGRPFDFRKETSGYVTLLFFGYTHCPDVCPVHMSNIAQTLKNMPAPDASRIKVVFVTNDPERDTAPRLRAWLDAFDPTFIGLTGSTTEIRAAEAAAHLPPSEKDTTAGAGAGSYLVGHAAYVYACTPDNICRFLYPFGFRQVNWAHDLPLLVAWPTKPS